MAGLALDSGHLRRNLFINIPAFFAITGSVALKTIGIFMHFSQVIECASVLILMPPLKMAGMTNHAFTITDIIDREIFFLRKFKLGK